MTENARLFLRLYTKPLDAIGGFMDSGSILYGIAAVLLVAFLLQMSLGVPLPEIRPSDPLPAGTPPHLRPESTYSVFSPIVVLAMFYAPAVLLAITLIAGLGSARWVFERDYSSLLTCASMAWAAAHLPVALALFVTPQLRTSYAWIPAYAYFAFLMTRVVRTVFGAEDSQAIGAVAISWLPLAAGLYYYREFGHFFRFLASPFLLYYAYIYFNSELRNFGSIFRNRQGLRRYLESCTVNPRDADAHYQIGLIHQQRRQYSEAIARFQQAVAIDPAETDAHFQLGRIARQEGRLANALTHFQTVVDQNEKHSSHEVWREVGALHLAAKQYQHARDELALFVEKRAFDPEGLFYYGQALAALGEVQPASAAFQRAVEAARTAPSYRRGPLSRWSRLAQKELRRLR